MRIPYGFILTGNRALRINKDEADVIATIFDFYIAGASLGKIVDMLYEKQIPSPTGKYVAIIGWEKFLDAQFEKSTRCNIDYDQEGSPRKDTRYVSPDMTLI